MNKMIIIIGRTASGKDTFANLLKDNTYFRLAKSHTTRPKRFVGEDTHIFISQEVAANIPDTDKLAVLHRNGHESFLSKSFIISKKLNVFILDPTGAVELMNAFPDDIFELVYIFRNSCQRRESAIIRSGGNSLEFDLCDREESEVFDKFEKMGQQMLENETRCPFAIHYIENNGDLLALQRQAEAFAHQCSTR